MDVILEMWAPHRIKSDIICHEHNLRNLDQIFFVMKHNLRNLDVLDLLEDGSHIEALSLA